MTGVLLHTYEDLAEERRPGLVQARADNKQHTGTAAVSLRGTEHVALLHRPVLVVSDKVHAFTEPERAFLVGTAHLTSPL